MEAFSLEYSSVADVRIEPDVFWGVGRAKTQELHCCFPLEDASVLLTRNLGLSINKRKRPIVSR